jgi:hypothetical protein
MRYVSDFISTVKVRQAEISSSLAHGNVNNYEGYLRLVGEYRGLESALEILNNLLKEDDDDR